MISTGKVFDRDGGSRTATDGISVMSRAGVSIFENFRGFVVMTEISVVSRTLVVVSLFSIFENFKGCVVVVDCEGMSSEGENAPSLR